MALELGGRLKECVVILSKVWTYTAELSGEERTGSFLPVSGQLCEWQTLQMGHPDYAFSEL